MGKQLLSFACSYCHAQLQTPISYAGHYAPCPRCGRTLLAPLLPPIVITPLPSETSQPNILSECMAKSVMSPRPVKQMSEVVQKRHNVSGDDLSSRMILPDMALSRDEIERSENGRIIRIFLCFVFVLIVILVVIWLMKSVGNRA